MSKEYPVYKQLDLPAIAEEMLALWDAEDTFRKSVDTREGCPPFVFYEGPPSANGMPGIHHVMARTIKDIFCRHRTLKGFQVKRKAGWDTHGLPIELGVEKELGITKEDIGKSITIAEYNEACRKAVMKYTDVWNDLTRKMGYWVDMENPYITYENTYIESVWWLLSDLYKKGLLYKGYTIQPYSPKAGTGLSSHELNQPGTYRDVKDTSAIAQFRVIEDAKSAKLFDGRLDDQEVYFLAWTTTPWTLPSNTALCVGPRITYVRALVHNKFSHKEIYIVCAKELLSGLLFGTELLDEPVEFSGSELVGTRYEQLLDFALPHENPGEAFRVIPGDFVTTVDGTGIVHIAPTFGQDDARVAREAGIPAMLVLDNDSNLVPLVDLQGKFLDIVNDGVFLYGNEYVKEDYLNESERIEEFRRQKEVLENAGKLKSLSAYLNVDIRIVLKLQEEDKLYSKASYEHSYPHCWRTDKPILYYPLDSWFVKTTAAKDRLIALNKTINWKPESTGTGRFGNWLENLQDWNLSRSRFWGIPLPIWRTEDGLEAKCIGSVEELKDRMHQCCESGRDDRESVG
jgi:isoleucyl-tRNA synthetase